MDKLFQAQAGKFAVEAEMVEQPIVAITQPFEEVDNVSHLVTDGEMYTPAQRGEFLAACQNGEVVVIGAKFLAYVNESGLIRRLVYSDQDLALQFLEEYDPVLEMKLVAKDHYELTFPFVSGERYDDVS
jgi:hypothetical protein